MKTLPTLILATAALALSAAKNIQGAATPAIFPRLLTTFTNPTPAYNDSFGYSVAAVGTKRVLIGAYRNDTGATNAGAAFLFSINGTLLTTFTNPAPAVSDQFGSSVAALGTDRVLIGVPGDDRGVINAGAAYMFGTTGTLLTTFTNPSPTAYGAFGWSMTAVGTDHFLIGAPYNDTGADGAGAAYLFDTNGVLLTTFTNPTPAVRDSFGISVAATGSDRVLIGADRDDTGAEDAGAAYLFSTNGALLTIFTNPTPAVRDSFGVSLAAVGTEQVLIGAYNVQGANSAGAAYLFGTNGMLLTTLTNPSPAYDDEFGTTVAAVGTDQVLIAAPCDDTGAPCAGVAYLFSTGGALLTVFTNPTPELIDGFGWSVAAVGTDRVLIGALYDNTGATYAGAAYLFSLEPITPPGPSLSTSRNPQGSTLTISWPAAAEGWLLERTNALPSAAASSWPPVPPPYQTNAGSISVTFTNPPTAANQFFRLRQP